VTTGLTNDFVELTIINSMKQFALFVTTKQSAYNFSGPPGEARLANQVPPLTFL